MATTEPIIFLLAGRYEWLCPHLRRRPAKIEEEHSHYRAANDSD